jgi:4-hydroxy-3-polyprenylbenzoate decarboxylase
VQGVWEYTIRYLTVISIKQKYGGHAKRAAMALLGSTYGYHRRFVIIVDDDIDPSNIDDVLWALSTRCDPATAINVITEAWSTLTFRRFLRGRPRGIPPHRHQPCASSQRHCHSLDDNRPARAPSQHAARGAGSRRPA